MNDPNLSLVFGQQPRTSLTDALAGQPDPVSQVAPPVQQTLDEEMAIVQAQAAAFDDERARLEREHSVVGTFLSEAGRGVIDAVLASGALAGAGIEATGELFDSKETKKFGRELGEAASGTGLLKMFQYLGYEAPLRELQEMQKAYPTVAALGHGTGAIGAGLLAGGVSAGASTLTRTIAIGALEGAGGGAQAGYEANAPLRDVLSAAVVGAVIGGGSVAAAHGLDSLVKSAGLRRAAKELQEESALVAAGTSRKAVAAKVARTGTLDSVEEYTAEMANALLTAQPDGSSIIQAGATKGGIQTALRAAQKEAGEALSSIRETISKGLASHPEAAVDLAPVIRDVDTRVLQPLLTEGIEPAKRAQAAATRELLADAAKTAPVTLEHLDEAVTLLAKEATDNPVARQAHRMLAPELETATLNAITALGEDPALFSAAARKHQVLSDLQTLVSVAGSEVKAKGALDYLMGGASAAGAMMGGVPGVMAAAQGALTSVASKYARQRAASTAAVLANSIVVDNVADAVGKVLPVLSHSFAPEAARKATERMLERKRSEPPTSLQRQENYSKHLRMVNEAVSTPDFDQRAATLERFASLPPALLMAASAEAEGRMSRLLADMPKPTSDVRGTARNSLSSEQIRLGEAMYEATTDPLSIFDDFARGAVNYDKVKYVWSQYPDLQQAAQAGTLDAIQLALTEDERLRIPETILTQLDFLLGFEGELQPTIGRQFASRIDQIAQAQQQENPPPRPGGKLRMPGTQPTFTQRLSGQRG